MKRKRRTKWYKATKKKKKWNYHYSTVPLDSQKDLELYNDTIEKYSREFTELCQSAYHAYQGLEYYHTTKNSKLMYEAIIPSQDKSIEIGDIENRLRFIWFNCARKYYARKPKVTFFNYLFRMSLWELKRWLNVQSKVVVQEPFVKDISYNFKSLDIPQINTRFVLEGTDRGLLSSLNAYERYLIYLRYVEENSIAHLARLTGHYKSTIKNQYAMVINKLTDLTLCH